MALQRRGGEEKANVVRPEFEQRERRRGGRQWTLWDAIRTFSMRNVLFALVLGILAGGFGAALGLHRPTVYTGKALLLIDQPKLLVNSTDEGPLRKLALLRLKYAELADTPAITQPAATELGISEQQVRGSVTALANPQTLLLEIDANDATRAQADRIANTVARAVITYADQEQARQNVPQTDRFRFGLVQPASLAVKTQPSANRALQSAFALAIIAFGLAYVVLQLVTAPVRLG